MKLRILYLLLCVGFLPCLRGQVPQIINYQSSIAIGGTNYHGLGHFKFALVSGDAQETYWSNDSTSVGGAEPKMELTLVVANGQYEVLLGDTTLTNMVPIPPTVFAHNNVHVRVWFSDGLIAFQPVQPDQPVAAVGYAMMAANVADGAVTATKLADGAVTAAKLAPNAVTAGSIAVGSIGQAQLAPGAVGSPQLAPGAVAANLNASGGLVLSDQANATNLLQAGFQKIGTVMADADQWQSFGPFTPAARYGHVTVWTGREMIIWGESYLGARLPTGARYDPMTDTWTAMSTKNSITAGDTPIGVWTGTEMIVLVNSTSTAIGSIYNPTTDTWRRLSMSNGPTNTAGLSAIWTGRELIVWGGSDRGRRYDPSGDTWKILPAANDPSARSYQSVIWTGTEMIVWGGLSSSGSTPLYGGARYNPAADTWTPMTVVRPPSPRFGHSAVWTGKEMIVWGGYANRLPLMKDTGAAYDPATDTWKLIPTTNEPSGRYNHVALWTGTEMIVWGGRDPSVSNGYLHTGGRYDPSTGTWQPLAVKGTAEAVSGSSAVWTGSELIIWGGQVVDSGNLNRALSNAGSRYRPDRDEWRAIFGSPVGRAGHSAVWTGSELIVWGGSQDANPGRSDLLLRSGARFNPVSRRWSPISTENAPSARQNHRTVWTGTEMIVWGGEGYTSGPYGSQSYGTLDTGGRYNPTTDTWMAMDTGVSPQGRASHTMVWTGKEVIIFGGRTTVYESLASSLDNGARYNPETDSWASLNRQQAPSPRQLHMAVWTGREMIIWGGQVYTNNNQTGLLNDGARYNPVLNTWTPVTTNGAPRPTPNGAVVWTGQEMIVVSSDGSPVPGGRYNPLADRWEPVSNTGAPKAVQPVSVAVSAVAAVWTGNEVLVWGDVSPKAGARYNPLTDTWTPMTSVGTPGNRRGHVAVWTGEGMLVFGGAETGSSTLPDVTLLYNLTRPLYLYGHR